MTVTVTKPPFSLRSELNSLRKKTGIKGEDILRSNTTDDLYYSAIGTNRNLLINGNFNISQRGDFTTASAYPSATIRLDRWISYMYLMTSTLQHTTVTINGETHKAAKIVLTNSTAGEALIEQRIEASNVVPGRTYTMSAWVRTNNQTIRLRCYDGAAWITGSLGDYCPPDDKWHRITFTYKYLGPVNGYHPVQIYCTSGATGEYYEVTNVQVEAGSVATPYEYRSYQQELALCQRYFSKSTPYGTVATDGVPDPRGAIFSWYGLTTSSSNTIALPVPMRALPTITLYKPSQSSTAGRWAYFDGGSWVTMSANNVTVINESLFQINATSPVNVTIGYSLIGSGVWTASAEL